MFSKLLNLLLETRIGFFKDVATLFGAITEENKHYTVRKP